MDKKTSDDLGIVRRVLAERIKLRAARGAANSEAEKKELNQWRRELKAVERQIEARQALNQRLFN